MKAVILAGGVGSRLGKLTKNIPKPLIKVAGRPVLEHQFLLLKKYGITEVYVCIGYLGEQIRKFAGDGSKWGLKVKFSEGDVSLNTADRVAKLEGIIKSDFLLFYGDVLMNFDIGRLIKFHKSRKFGQLATLVVHPNNHPFDSDLVEADSFGKIIAFHSKPHPENKFFQNLSSTGARIISPKIFPILEKYPNSDFGKKIFPLCLKQGKVLLAYSSPEYFKDMGTPKRLKQVENDLKKGVVKSSSLKEKHRAIFFDRDGVLNEEVDQLSRVEDMKVYPFSAQAIKLLNNAGYLAIVITNQPQIARGYITEQYLRLIHNKLEWILGQKGAKLDAIYYCPHHIIDKTVLKPVKKYAIDCDCRKPKPGLIFRAAADLNIDLKKSYFVGDSFRDVLAAENAGVKFLGVRTGYACKDGQVPISKKYKIYSNVLAAVKAFVKT